MYHFFGKKCVLPNVLVVLEKSGFVGSERDLLRPKYAETIAGSMTWRTKLKFNYRRLHGFYEFLLFTGEAHRDITNWK